MYNIKGRHPLWLSAALLLSLMALSLVAPASSQAQKALVAAPGKLVAAPGELLPLVVSVSPREAGVVVKVRQCPDKLSPPIKLVGEDSQTTDAGGSASFAKDLRLVGAKPGSEHCLQVYSPDTAAKPDEVTVTIRSCASGEMLTNISTCLTCVIGQYSFNPQAGCTICHPNAQCPGGNIFLPRRNYWHPSRNSTTVVPCPDLQACKMPRNEVYSCQIGRVDCSPTRYWNAQCSKGYRGVLCGSCQTNQGYAPLGILKCARCLDKPIAVVLLVVALVVALVIIAWVATTTLLLAERVEARGDDLHALRDVDNVASVQHDPRLAAMTSARRSIEARNSLEAQPRKGFVAVLAQRAPIDVPAIVKTLVFHLQYLAVIDSLVAGSSAETFHSTVRGIFRMLALFAIDANRLVSLWCVGVRSNLLRMVLGLVLPFGVIIVACVVVALLSRFIARSRALPSTLPSCGAADAVIATSVVGVFLFYASLVWVTFSGVSCVRIPEVGSRWTLDMDLKCLSSEHLKAGVPIAAIGMFLFCILLPLLTIFKLWSNRELVQNGADSGADAAAALQFRRRYGFLFQLYRPQCMLWEVLMCAQTVAMLVVLWFGLAVGSFNQVLFLMLVLGVGNTLVHAFRPYKSVQVHVLYLSSTFALLLTCAGVLGLMYSDAMKSYPSWYVRLGLRLINLIFIAWCLLEMIRTGIVGAAGKGGCGCCGGRKSQKRGRWHNAEQPEELSLATQVLKSPEA